MVDGGATPGRPLTGDIIGLFGPDSAAWRLQREAFLLLGAGPRALLLQLAHPAVAAGVADHSDFRADPWRRLDGTLRSYLRIVFGTSAAARAEIRRLHRLHSTVTGPGYAARDPSLSLWVHATLIDSTLAVNAAWDGPLARDLAERFYAESLPLGRAFGIPDAMLPPDLAAFERYMAEQIGPGGPVVVGSTARELADAVLHPPLPGTLGRVPLDPRLHAWTLWPAVGLLPPTIRAGYGLRWGVPEQAVAAWLVAGWRAWAARLPRTWRWIPHALAAERRLARTATEPPGPEGRWTGPEHGQ